MERYDQHGHSADSESSEFADEPVPLSDGCSRGGATKKPRPAFQKNVGLGRVSEVRQAARAEPARLPHPTRSEMVRHIPGRAGKKTSCGRKRRGSRSPTSASRPCLREPAPGGRREQRPGPEPSERLRWRRSKEPKRRSKPERPSSSRWSSTSWRHAWPSDGPRGRRGRCSSRSSSRRRRRSKPGRPSRNQPSTSSPSSPSGGDRRWPSCCRRRGRNRQ